MFIAALSLVGMHTLIKSIEDHHVFEILFFRSMVTAVLCMLYLKHNLNAQAVSSIKNEFGLIRADINSLIREMNASIAEADKFVSSLN